ncbi:SMI1/KNR4 family protein [Pseudalkalibacillus sp. SCS-8]|uniref:SMI1/KNR4 family protein n=1 Tax=Pseudalkalibacillus nanhaiensis TaxID=3115291 RepID=UPI0032DB90DB
MEEFLLEFDKNEPTSLSVINDFEKQATKILPTDYANFMITANGGEGSVGSSYLILWKIEDINKLNQAYDVEEFASGLLIIGSDGGDTAYCINYRKEDIFFVKVPFIGMSIDMVEVCGESFNDFLRYLYELE